MAARRIRHLRPACGRVPPGGVEYCRERYQNRAYPHALYDAVVDNGWIGTAIPEAYGGQGGDHVELAVLLEALGKFGYDFSMPVLTTATVADLLIDHGSEAQRERLLPQVLDGELRFSIGVTEPEAGSDAASIQTRAEPTETGYRVTGEKIYQSGAQAPGNTIGCYVRTGPGEGREGLSVLLIPNDRDGVELTELPLVTRKAVGTAHVFFDDVSVAEDNRIGAEGDGWRTLRTIGGIVPGDRPSARGPPDRSGRRPPHGLSIGLTARRG